jgi:hypothetical protein
LKQAGESGAAELQKSLQQERERSARLEQDLAAARRDVETQTALVAKASEDASRRKQAAEAGAAELRQSMQIERERVDALAQDLSMTRSANYAYEAQACKAGDEAAELRQAAANGVPSPRKSAQDERDRAEWLERDLATARRDLETQAAGRSQPDSEEAAVAAGLVARASALLRQGDTGAARIVLERAVKMGSAQAGFLLAETYDPLILANGELMGRARCDQRRSLCEG